MGREPAIITVGLAPAWDIICRGRHLAWGRHQEIDEQVVRPAGKAMNISYALAWLGRSSTAMGLWGRDDYGELERAVRDFAGAVRVRMTPARGRTRRNVTVVDTAGGEEMHLRRQSELASRGVLGRLKAVLRSAVRPGDICVFAGAMPGGALLDAAISVVRACRDSGSRIIVDTYGPALERTVALGLAELIKPNVQELRALLGAQVRDRASDLAGAARPLLDRVGAVLVSRGRNGAVLVTRMGSWTGRCRGRRKVLSTVGCGDYLLAGFIKGLGEGMPVHRALSVGLKTATARAWGLAEKGQWSQAGREISVEVRRI